MRINLQVCVMDLAESDWQMLPRQARFISSNQVQMQRQPSLVRTGILYLQYTLYSCDDMVVSSLSSPTIPCFEEAMSARYSHSLFRCSCSMPKL